MWDVRCEILRQNFLRLLLKTFFLLVHIFLENDISTARTWIVIDFTPTFYLEICEIPKKIQDEILLDQYRYFFWNQYWVFFRPKFSRPIQRLLFETKTYRERYWNFFWDQIFPIPILRLFSRPNVFKTVTETFFETWFFETDTDTFKKWEKSQYWEVSRRDVTLWLQQDI